MALEIITSIDLDLTRPNFNVVHAKQYDSSGRKIRAHLLNGGVPWAVPSGVYPVIRFMKTDRLGGFYDTDENGDYAIAFPVSGDRSYVDLTLALQALTTAGTVFMEVNFYSADAVRITSFSWKLDVEPAVLPDSEIVSSEYYNALTEAASIVVVALEDAKESLHDDYEAYSAEMGTQVNAAETAASDAEEAKTYAQLFTGAPLAASMASGMTDHSLIYVYTGTTSGSLTNGHWYYWDGSAWADGGVYNATALTTDTTLSVAGAAADAAACGDLKSALNSITNGIDRSAVTDNLNYSSNGVTIVRVSNNRIKLYGTATAARYYSFLNGQATSRTSSGTFGETLPAGEYVIRFNMSGSNPLGSLRFTYTTFANVILSVAVNTEVSATFENAVMVGFMTSSGRDYGTESDPTYLDVYIQQLTAKDEVARKELATLNNGVVIDRSETIDSTTDIDDILNPGIYRWFSSSVPVNSPTTLSATMMVMSRYNSTGILAQLIITANGKIIVRARSSNAWNDWQFYSNDNLSLIDKLVLEATDDMDDVIEPGYYNINSNSIPAHLPVQSAGTVLVIRPSFSSSRTYPLTQIFFTTNQIYYRMNYSTGFSPWKNVIAVSSSGDLVPFSVTEGILGFTGTVRSSSGGICLTESIICEKNTALHINKPENWVVTIYQGDSRNCLTLTDRLSYKSDFLVDQPYVGITFYKVDQSGNVITTTTVSDFDSSITIERTKPDGSMMEIYDGPQSQGVYNLIRRAQQAANIVFTTKAALPTQYENYSSNHTIPVNYEMDGAPYSSTRVEGLYVPQCVNFQAFMTAVRAAMCQLSSIYDCAVKSA